MTDRDTDLVATPSQTVGPFFDFGLTTPNAALGQMAGPETPGERIRLRVRVYDGAGAVGARRGGRTVAGRCQRRVSGRFRSSARHAGPGVSGLGTVGDQRRRHVRVPDHPARSRPHWRRRLAASHVDVCLFARGLLRHIFTRIYFAGDPALSEDPVLALVPEDRRETLLAHLDGDAWVFDLRLQGKGETVFFDL